MPKKKTHKVAVVEDTDRVITNQMEHDGEKFKLILFRVILVLIGMATMLHDKIGVNCLNHH